MPALSIRIALDCFYLLIFYSEKFSTDVCRLPYAVNVDLNLSIICILTAILSVYYLYIDCCNLSSPPASSSFCYLRAEMAK